MCRNRENLNNKKIYLKLYCFNSVLFKKIFHSKRLLQLSNYNKINL